MPIMITIYLQVSKKLEKLFLRDSDFFNLVAYFISYLIFLSICHLVNLVYQNPIDKLKKKFLN